MIAKNYNNIKKGILGFFMLFLILTPLSHSQNTGEKSQNTSSLSFSSYISITSVFAESLPPASDFSKTAPQNSPVAKSAGANNESKTWSFNIGEAIISAIGNAMLNVASAVTWVGGKMLELSIEYLVLGMGSMVNGEGGLGATINSVWSIIRDISNLAFIFGFIYIGIRTIIDPENASTKRFLAKIIIGALLINFSLFFVKAIIDFSNFTAVQIYNGMVTGTGNLSGTITRLLGVADFFAPDVNALAQFGGKAAGFWFYAFASVFLIVTGFVLAAAAIMLIMRFVVLIFIMIFSPLLFAATVFPQTEHYASDLWKKLISNAFYAPVYLLLTFIVLKMVENLNIKPAGATFITAMTNQSSNDSFGVIIQFMIIIFFMIGTLTIANKMGIAGSEMITAKTKMLIGASTAGLAARTGRATVGRWSANAADSDALKDKASRSGVSGWAARQRLKAYSNLGDTSFDARNTGVGKKLDVGKGRKGGYATVKKEVEAAEEKVAKSLGVVGDDDFRVEVRKKEMESEEKHLRHLQEELKATTDKDARKKLSDEIEEVKHHAHEAKIKYESEKQRRILGSTFTEGESGSALEEAKRQYDMAQEEVSDGWKDYQRITDEGQRKVLKEQIIAMQKKAKEAKAKVAAAKGAGTDGYASVLEKSNFITSWPTGRLVAHNQSAGKALRKKYEKGIPKAKDDHGGGDHDAHGDAHEEEDHTPSPAGGGHGPVAGDHGPAGGGHGPVAGDHGPAGHH